MCKGELDVTFPAALSSLVRTAQSRTLHRAPGFPIQLHTDFTVFDYRFG
jgi:hypothetical protein